MTQKDIYDLRRRWLCKKISDWVTPLGSSRRGRERRNAWLRKAGIHVAPNALIAPGFTCILGREENITIEDYALIGTNARFWNFGDVTIGRFALIAAEVNLSNGGHHRDSLAPFSGPLIVGAGCWIGQRAVIVGPLTIGENAIVGAGSVVTRDVAPGTIVAGVPAKLIGQRQLPEKVYSVSGYYSPRTFELVK